ncbi:MAG TPA: PspC domain-containing protein [Allosphingosinicella sp.]|jgi:phage shock protein PspC (stress-responsive transcriptional regulator)
MQTSSIPVYARDHTILGICEAIGEDFGFNPLLVRIPLAVCLLVAPLAVVGAYLGLGVVVGLSRLLAPDPRPAAEAAKPAAARAPAETGDNDDGEMAIAA